MLKTFIAAAAAFFLFSGFAGTQEMTCAERAQRCIAAGGSNYTCNEARRMAACMATGIYTAPNGSTYPATKK